VRSQSIPGELGFKASLALVGWSLEARRDVCVWVRDGFIESVEGRGSCPADSMGGEGAVLLPQPANAHVHSGDHAFPEYATELPLEEAVAPPGGVKHRLLASTPRHRLVEAISEYYTLAWRAGTGLLVDFREGGGEGCRLALEALSRIPPGMDVLVLGRPGPGWPGSCAGVGLNSPLDYSLEQLASIVAARRPAMTHVAETREAREAGDLERALEAGFDAVVHGVYLSRDDLEALASRGVGLVVCTRSNAWHSVGMPPAPDAWEAGLRVGLGTDNAGWFTPDIWREAEALALITRLKGYRDPRLPRLVLRSLFIDGYLVSKRKPRLIVEGGEAHFLLVAARGRGVLEARNVYWALVKRVGPDAILARVDGDTIYYLDSD
jgi:cytosine/adenosine deaminase-related metal-dependent hydrolase